MRLLLCHVDYAYAARLLRRCAISGLITSCAAAVFRFFDIFFVRRRSQRRTRYMLATAAMPSHVTLLPAPTCR